MMLNDYEEIEIAPEREVKHGSCCNLWIEVPVDIGMDLELIRRRLRLAGFKDVTEYRYSADNMMFLIRTVIAGDKGVPESALKQITKLTREVADGKRAAFRDPPRLFDRLEEKLRWMKDGDVIAPARRVLGALYEMSLHEFESDERELVAAYLHKFQAAIDHHRKRGHTPRDFTMWQVASRVRRWWHCGDTGLFIALLSELEDVLPLDRVAEIGSAGADARTPEARPTRGAFANKTLASLEVLRAALR